MYHYVRPIKESSHPKIKGLELEGFKRQLDFFSDKFEFITAEAVIDSITNGTELPEKSCWLTFDDGYKDHYLFVLPELLKRGIQGSFFPPVEPVIKRTMLDVNSLHFILASVSDIDLLIQDLAFFCRSFEISNPLGDWWDKYAVAGRFDSKEIVYIKRLLQHVLPKTVRSDITRLLFEKHVGIPQEEFADELYVSLSDVKDFVDSGMYVGSHGYSHSWLNHETRESQRFEISQSLDFLGSVGASTHNWIMCYPYGAYSEVTLELLGEADCAVALTTEVATADTSIHRRLAMPRFDTNDFPQ